MIPMIEDSQSKLKQILPDPPRRQPFRGTCACRRLTFFGKETTPTMKIAVAASLVASAAAFAPAAKQASSTAVKSYENELGVIVSSIRIMRGASHPLTLDGT